jgi:hypothetical protein
VNVGRAWRGSQVSLNALCGLAALLSTQQCSLSYARMSAESDVYVYDSGEGLVCFACTLAEYAAEFRSDSRSQMLNHLRQHVELGHRVPRRAFARLSEELTTAGDQVDRD